MRDALGGLVNIVIIVVFMVIVSGYLAFNVNYSKAFRVKNKIISAIEEREGLDEKAKKQIEAFEKSIGYNINTPNLSDAGEREANLGFYINKVERTAYCEEDKDGNLKKKVYYEITTFVSVDIPIIEKIMPYFEFFHVKGATKTISILC